ncbi:MAG: glycosyl hydrolase family 28 protein [Clostridium sp.]|nr:glycosyl hydrolase family 28 protein [Clostridium sp.]
MDEKVLPHNDRYQVAVRRAGSADEWLPLTVLRVEVDGDTHSTAAMAQFDMGEPVEVKVSGEGVSGNAVVRPLSKSIHPQCCGRDEVRFVVKEPSQLSIEFGGDRLHNLHLFCNPPETEAYHDVAQNDSTINWDGGSKDIFRKDSRLIYFGPGVHKPKDLPGEEINIPGNCTVYLAPGAVVCARLRVDKAENVRIIGRGILYHPLRGVEITHSRNVLVEGITVINPLHYTILGGCSENVTIRNIKSFSSRPWSDGIDLMSCRNWNISHVFLRTSDDCLAFYNHRWWYWGDSRDITVEHSVLWADVAHAMNVGVHGDDMSETGETIERIVFRDIDVLNVDEDDDEYRGVMAVNCGDKNRVCNVLFEDIRVEDCEEARLIDLKVNYNEKYNRAPGFGICDVTFRNITYNGGQGMMYPSRIKGYNALYGVRNVRIENVVINGKRLTSVDGFDINEYTGQIAIHD